MAQHNDFGKWGEDKACEYLQERGYEVLIRNWRFEKAEIDIIATKNGVVVFVEVKTRSTIDFGLPQDFVKTTKIKNLAKAAHQYVLENDIDQKLQFDIIAICKEGQKISIEHLEDAFYFF